MSGGAVVHRMGLSESVLVFDQHRVFIPDFEKRLTEAKKADPERKIAVEFARALPLPQPAPTSSSVKSSPSKRCPNS